LLQAGRRDEAIAHLEAALRSPSDNPEARNGLGNAFSLMPNRIPDGRSCRESGQNRGFGRSLKSSHQPQFCGPNRRGIPPAGRSRGLAFQAERELLWIITARQRFLATQSLSAIEQRLADRNSKVFTTTPSST
jgi:hypothetical protein